MRTLCNWRIFLICALIFTSHASTLSPRAHAGEAKAASQAAAERAGQHGFDFAFGAWEANLKLLQHPLTGSHTWVDYEGTSLVRRIWNGRANMAELEVDGPSGHVEGLSLRLYNPKSHEWSVYFANSENGSLGTPMIGGFTNGRGEFYDQEEFQGRAIFVRFIFSDIAANSFRFEQSFSADGGKTWEPNWIASFIREKK